MPNRIATAIATADLPVARAIAARAADLTLSSAEVARFSRHLLLPEVGLDGQKKLRAARILVIGAGGLGSPISLYLAAAGVGTIGLVDHDTVDVSNLQRQILYADRDAGRPKVDAAAERLKALAPNLNLELHALRLDETNVEQILSAYDVIVDGTDNFATRYLVNDCCVMLGKPNVYGSIYRFDGQASVFYSPHGPCYRCLFPMPPPPGQVPSCAEGGVLGVLPAQIGSVQATEALKLALGIGTALIGRLQIIDALSAKSEEFKVSRDDDCPVCGTHPTILTLQESVIHCGITPTLGVATDSKVPLTTVEELADLRQRHSSHTLIDVRSAAEAAICRIDGSLLIPLADLPKALDGLPRHEPLIVHCKSGARSATAVGILRDHGFTNATSLDGGILRWIDRVDPTLPRY